MKTSTLTLLLVLLSLVSISPTYKIFKAKTNGNWSTGGTRNTAVRADGVSKDRYIIPAGYTVTATSSYDYAAMGNVEVFVNGTLNLASGTIFSLTQTSSILVTGAIRTFGPSAVNHRKRMEIFDIRLKHI